LEKTDRQIGKKLAKTDPFLEKTDGQIGKKFLSFQKKDPYQGCQMVSSQDKNPNLCKLWRGLAIEDVGIFYVHLVNFPAIWHNIWPFGIFYPVLVCCIEKNLATLIRISLFV
jgi:hypothetical protein